LKPFGILCLFNLNLLVFIPSKFQTDSPWLVIEDSPYSDCEDPDLIGEYCSMHNELIVYWKNIKSIEDLIKTLIHEYQHYLQSPSWMTRYYKMGYDLEKAYKSATKPKPVKVTAE
jgi:hypothetical protein